MRFDIITIFPELFLPLLECGILRRARQSGIAQIRIVNLRDFASDKHKTVDDRPYGGGEGMVHSSDVASHGFASALLP